MSGGASRCNTVRYRVESTWKVYHNLVDHPEGVLRVSHCVLCVYVDTELAPGAVAVG